MSSPPKLPGGSHELPQSPPPPKQVQLRGLHPLPFIANKDSHKITSKPTTKDHKLPAQRNVECFTVSPSEFRSLVQRLTGHSNKIDVSPTASLASTKKNPPSRRERRSTSYEMILQWLGDPTISVVGVYGTRGVGKSTLVAQIHDKFQTDRTNVVSLIVVSKNFSIHKLQDDIARTILLDLSDEDDKIKRREKLAKALNEKKIILILDDVWDYIPLDEVGIPVGEDGCKLVFTTPLMKMCQTMNCQKLVMVKPLSKEEGWTLFMDKIGPDTVLPRSIEETARSIVNECSGLPLAIIVMAGSMKGVDDQWEWSNALETIRGKEIEKDDKSKVFHLLKYCYDKLMDSNVQQCFLHCALYPKDFKIDREMLIENFIDEGLIDGKNKQAELKKGHHILNKLENVCLLESGTCNYGKRYIKVNSLVRQFLLSLSRVPGPS